MRRQILTQNNGFSNNIRNLNISQFASLQELWTKIFAKALLQQELLLYPYTAVLSTSGTTQTKDEANMVI